MNEMEIRRQTTPEPWTDFDRVFDHLRRRALATWGPGWFPEFFASVEPFELTQENFHTAPTDISDTGKAYKISAAIPGSPKDQFKISVRGNHGNGPVYHCRYCYRKRACKTELPGSLRKGPRK